MHICFVMPQMYPLLSGAGEGHSGGSETNMFNIARALALSNHKVTAIVGDYGQPDRSVKAGINVLRIRNSSALTLLRISRSAFDVYRLLSETMPEVVIHQNFGYLHGLIAWCCRILGIRYVYFTASQGDVDGTRYSTSSPFIRWLWLYGIRNNRHIVVQALEHKELLLQHFGCDSVVIPNGVDTRRFFRSRPHGSTILWVAHWRQVKRPDLVLELARQLPHHNFVMCGGFYDKDLYQALLPTVPHNVEIKGRVSEHDLYEAYQDALILINTSDYEGIPVTFDEAWSCEVPVVTLNVDPDGMIQKNKLGYRSSTLDQMKRDIETIFNNRSSAVSMGQQCRNYVIASHNIDVVAGEVEHLLQ